MKRQFPKPTSIQAVTAVSGSGDSLVWSLWSCTDVDLHPIAGFPAELNPGDRITVPFVRGFRFSLASKIDPACDRSTEFIATLISLRIFKLYALRLAASPKPINRAPVTSLLQTIALNRQRS